jgi:hypothetical protein
MAVRGIFKGQRRAKGVKYVNRVEGQRIVDRQARRYLNMSGAEFLRKYDAGEFGDDDRSEIVRVAMLIPLAR